MTTIEKLRQEIKQLRKLIDDHNYYLDNSEQALGYGLALDDIEKFLDTLEAEERPEPYIPVYDEEYLTEKQRLFKGHHGEVDVDKMLAECRGYDEEKEEPDKSLEEVAEEFAEGEWDGVAVDTDGNPLYAQDEIEYAFKAGAKWQAEQFAKIVRANLSEIGNNAQSQFEQLYFEITGTKMYGGYND